jgi:DNA processing protein
MNLQTAVAASLLPASRSRVAALFKEMRRQPPDAKNEMRRQPRDAKNDIRRQPGGAKRDLRRQPGGAEDERHRESGEALLYAVADACGLESWTADAALASADAMLGEAGRCGIEPVPWYEERYPVLLDCISDPPPVLWIRGDATVLARPTVAVVGSRAATDYARQVGERLGAELAARGIVVASGLARGVDSAAHTGCLRAGGHTVAVLGSGVDRIYPAEHEDLAASVCTHGTLVSELGLGAPPLPEHFPLRNRIISGISLAVVVVEASDKSGSLITARCALEQGRDVMAVPGSVLSGRNRGSHSLLKDGAKVVESADDILQELGWHSEVPQGRRGPGAVETDPLLARMEPGELYRLDDLMALTGAQGARLLTRLMELELQGRVVAGPGGVFGIRIQSPR